jgi:hypothetical protein
MESGLEWLRKPKDDQEAEEVAAKAQKREDQSVASEQEGSGADSHGFSQTSKRTTRSARGAQKWARGSQKKDIVYAE